MKIEEQRARRKLSFLKKELEIALAEKDNTILKGGVPSVWSVIEILWDIISEIEDIKKLIK